MVDNKKRYKVDRKQVKSLDPKDDATINEGYFGDDEDRSTQIVTNYYYSPHRE